VEKRQVSRSAAPMQLAPTAVRESEGHQGPRADWRPQPARYVCV